MEIFYGYNTYCATAIDYCNKLYKIEDKLKGKTIEEIYQGRQQFSLPIIKEFKKWLKIIRLVKKLVILL